MIEDTQGQQLIAAAPLGGPTGYVTSTWGVDLNAQNDAAHPRAGKALIPGMGGELMFRVDILGDFTVGAGNPIAQFHILMSDVASAQLPVHLGTNVVSLGCLAPITLPAQGATTFANGFAAGQLTAGSSFFIRANPWGSGLSTLSARDVYRYVGVGITTPHYVSATDRFSGGFIKAAMVQSADIAFDPNAFAYPAGVETVG